MRYLAFYQKVANVRRKQCQQIDTGRIDAGCHRRRLWRHRHQPLYAFEALAQTADGGIDHSEIIGVLSLALWALIIVVTLKYVLFLTRADNGRGRYSHSARPPRDNGCQMAGRIAAGQLGAALFYGDAIITPALSVLSAVEGLRTIPALADKACQRSLGLTVGILVRLFAIQAQGHCTGCRSVHCPMLDLVLEHRCTGACGIFANTEDITGLQSA